MTRAPEAPSLSQEPSDVDPERAYDIKREPLQHVHRRVRCEGTPRADAPAPLLPSPTGSSRYRPGTPLRGEKAPDDALARELGAMGLL